MHGESAPVFATVYNYVNEFKSDHTSTEDERCSGYLVEVSTPNMINKIHGMELSDQRIKLCDIVKATGVSKRTVASILQD